MGRQKSRVAWKFHDDATELSKNVYRKGISEQLKSDGSFATMMLLAHCHCILEKP